MESAPRPAIGTVTADLQANRVIAMTEQLKESLSAVLDDAADEFELRRVLDETGRNVALRETFERYQLVKSVLRGESRALTLRDRTELQRRVRESLDVAASPEAEEEATTAAAPEPVVTQPRMNWPVRAGMAAVALLAVAAFWFVGGNVDSGPQPTQVVAVPEPEVTPVADGLEATVPVWSDGGVPADDPVAARHQDYLAMHRRWAGQRDAEQAVTP